METHLLQDLAVVVAIAAATTLLCHWLRQPVVLGYLIAGLIIGPYTPPFSLISDLQSIHTMAELGLVFLMFTLGLEFSLPKLWRVGLPACVAASLEVIGMLWIGYELGQLFGWSRMDSIFLGAILSISSTTIIVKVFLDLKLMREEFAQMVFGILILEDVVAVLILSVLSGLGSGAEAGAAVALKALFHIGFFIALFLILGLALVPRILHWVSRFQNREMVGMVALGLCLAGSLWAKQVGFSIALGAFLAGVVVAAAREVEDIQDWIHPIRDMFSALFFVSAGMLIQPEMLITHKWAILAVTAVTLVAKTFTVSAGTFLVGYDVRTSLKVGVSMAQIGEFSFVIASLGASLKVTSDFLYPLAVTVAFLTTLFTPYMIRSSDRFADTYSRAMPAPMLAWMNRYQARIHRWKEENTRVSETTIFSKYLVRLAFYVFIGATAIVVTRTLSLGVNMAYAASDHLGFLQCSLWSLAGVLCLPAFMAVTKYVCHLLLLWVTQKAAAKSPSRWLQRLNIHVFYNVMAGIMVVLLGAVFLSTAGSLVASNAILLCIAAIVLLAGFGFRKYPAAAKEWMEMLLDHALGLATSEPTRRAVMEAKGGLSFSERIDEVMISEGAPSLHKSIRELGIRKKTGATIVAIYRNGIHHSNPSPDAELLPNDIVIVLGEPAQRQAALKLLKG